MITITATSIHVYNSTNNGSSDRHWRQRARAARVRGPIFATRPEIKSDTLQIKQLQEKIKKYEDDNEKLKLLASWNLRSTKSALKDISELIQILEADVNIKE